ncbi:MAG TPA: hypothetical protein VEK08_22875 [Planctomycetota bacterium]|nr:hypothetical protein [Planctomycetota bacterium]
MDQANTVDERVARSPVPWVLLALWLAWLIGMIAISSPEFGKARRNSGASAVQEPHRR